MRHSRSCVEEMLEARLVWGFAHGCHWKHLLLSEAGAGSLTYTQWLEGACFLAPLTCHISQWDILKVVSWTVKMHRKPNPGEGSGNPILVFTVPAVNSSPSPGLTLTCATSMPAFRTEVYECPNLWDWTTREEAGFYSHAIRPGCGEGKKVWRLRTDCFNEENEPFIVYVTPRPLAVSMFLFN
jgi:hypothetical protein